MKDFNLDSTRIPKHVAIIMDGNGRWAKKKGEMRIFGHTNGQIPLQRIKESNFSLPLLEEVLQII